MPRLGIAGLWCSIFKGSRADTHQSYSSGQECLSSCRRLFFYNPPEELPSNMKPSPVLAPLAPAVCLSNHLPHPSSSIMLYQLPFSAMLTQFCPPARLFHSHNASCKESKERGSCTMGSPGALCLPWCTPCQGERARAEVLMPAALHLLHGLAAEHTS